MENFIYIIEAKYMNIITYIIKTYFINICTYYTFLRITNQERKLNKKLISAILSTFIIDIIGAVIKYKSDSLISVICVIVLLGIVYAIIYKNNISSSILFTMVSLSINYILFFIAIIVLFIPNIIYPIQNDYINLLLMIIIHTFILCKLFKIRKLENGFNFFNQKLKNEYLNVLILNISIAISFSYITFTSFNTKLTGKMFFAFIIFSIIMFITIQQSFQLYYKQKLLIQDLEETKKELENKKQEIEKLEKENLNFSKISHSIAHKQKSLEHKLNEILLKNETSSEIDIRDRINTIAKEMIPKATLELSKTGITEIDDMLKYMQAECIKNKIEFELQISGNIHQMINNHIEKENLEILLADHIKNAIIAINHSDNSNKSILVRLGIIDGFYSLYIYDSGIEFEIETLKNLGKVPSTTHRESGGTGMGFMNTFDTLKKYKASMIINEYGHPSKDNYTKVIMIKFDKKNEFEIQSYRLEKMRR